MQELNAAWEVLGDPAARAAYDRQRAPRRPPPESTPPRPGTEAWYEEDARVDAELRRRRQEGIDLPSALLRSLPVLVVLGLLFAIFVFTAFAGGAGGSGG